MCDFRLEVHDDVLRQLCGLFISEDGACSSERASRPVLAVTAAHNDCSTGRQ